MLAFIKKWPVKVLGGRCLSLWGPRSPTPPFYTLYEYMPLYLFMGGRGEPALSSLETLMNTSKDDV